MPVIRFNNNANTNASDIARRSQGRTVFANSLIQQKTLDQNCLNRVVAGPAAATSYSGSKYIDQRVGTIFTSPAQAVEIVSSSPCLTPQRQEAIQYPNYVLECSDPLGIQIMASGTFTSFTFTTTSQGAGVIEFQYFLNSNYVASDLVVLGVDPSFITPPPGIDEVRYVFKCQPISVSITCSAPSKVLQWTIPYSFTNDIIGGGSVELTLYKHSSGTLTHILSEGETFTPTPAWGYDAWDIPPC